MERTHTNMYAKTAVLLIKMQNAALIISRKQI